MKRLCDFGDGRPSLVQRPCSISHFGARRWGELQTEADLARTHRALRINDPHPVRLASELVAQANASGAADYGTKPPSFDRFLAYMQGLLTAPRREECDLETRVRGTPNCAQ